MTSTVPRQALRAGVLPCARRIYRAPIRFALAGLSAICMSELLDGSPIATGKSDGKKFNTFHIDEGNMAFAANRRLFHAQFGVALLFCIVGEAFSSEDGVAQGRIFGIKIGETINLSPAEVKSASRDHIGSFVRHKAEKPSDIQYLQIFATPITRVVTSVDGASEFRTEKQARAFVAKYVKLLPQMYPGFEPTFDRDPETPLVLESQNWVLRMTYWDLKKQFNRPGGYAVRIGLKPAFGSPLNSLSSKSYDERKELLERDQRRSLDKAKERGELKGLI